MTLFFGNFRLPDTHRAFTFSFQPDRTLQTKVRALDNELPEDVSEIQFTTIPGGNPKNPAHLKAIVTTAVPGQDARRIEFTPKTPLPRTIEEMVNGLKTLITDSLGKLQAINSVAGALDKGPGEIEDGIVGAKVDLAHTMFENSQAHDDQMRSLEMRFHNPTGKPQGDASSAG